MRAVLLTALMVAGCSGCAGWQSDATGGLDKAHYVIGALFSVAQPLIDAKCDGEARKCIDAGVTDPNACPGWMTCNDVRERIGMSLVAAQRAIQAGQMAVAVGDSDSAAEATARALEIAEEIRKTLVEAGVL